MVDEALPENASPPRRRGRIPQDGSNGGPLNVRQARLQFAEVMKKAGEEQVSILAHGGKEVAAVVSRAAAHLLEAIRAATTPEEALAALAMKDASGKPFLNPSILSSLTLALRERRLDGSLSLMEFPRATPLDRDGTVWAVDFGGSELVPRGYVYMAGSGNDLMLGATIDVTADIILQLPNGQEIVEFTKAGQTLVLTGYKLAEPIEIEMIKIRRA